MHTATVLDHFKNPRNAGELPNATASVDVSNPVCGDILRLAARVENGLIAEVRFKCQGCVASLASASALTELVSGKSLTEARGISAAAVSEHLGGLPQATFHGAQPRDVMRLILGQGMWVTGIGLGIGVLASLGLARLMSNLLFGVGASDPLTYVSVVILLAFVALLACYIPARRAMRTDPMVALRHE